MELRLRELEACPVPVGRRRRAHVYVLAPVPALSPTLVRVDADDGARLERKLELAALPAEARPSAIATAADELLSALLESTASAGRADGAVGGAPEEPKAPPVEPALHWKLPKLELGLGGGGTLFSQRGAAYGAELLGRWRPRPSLSVALSLGVDRGSAAIPLEYALLAASVVRARDVSRGWHLGFDAGVDLLEPAAGLWLAINGGFALTRVHRRAELAFSTPGGPDLQRATLGSSWELAASSGGEVSYRIGPWGMALALAVLVPLTSPEAEWQPPVPAAPSHLSQQLDARTGFGEQLGGQLDLRLWFALGS